MFLDGGRGREEHSRTFQRPGKEAEPTRCHKNQQVILD
jgi:hypothetical protein